MILAQNHRQLSSGNRLYVLAVALLLAACSPKIVQKTQTPAQQTTTTKKTEKPAKQFTEAGISVFIPFRLQEINLANPTKSSVAKADMAVDFYQGLIMGIDSAAKHGLNFKVNVYDTQDDNNKLGGLLGKADVKNSNLLIGPVFPNGLKYIAAFSKANKIPVVSPLAASKPADFNNPNLISIVNDIDRHAEKIASYIGTHYGVSGSIVAVINGKTSAEQQLAVPLKAKLAKEFPGLKVQEFTSAYALETHLVKGKRYAVVVCSADSKFVNPTLQKLYRLKTLINYDINVFGHPTWLKQTYATDKLEALNTVISTSYWVDYKSDKVIDFVKAYRQKYTFEPSEYSFKGFDIGYYFASVIAKHGEDYVDYLSKEKYQGLQNGFAFAKDSQYGFYNEDLFLLRYKNLSLIVID